MSKIKIYALGGLDEQGKYLYCIEINEDIFIINAGVQYPVNNEFGVEFKISDVHYLADKKDRIKGIIITHAQDDMMYAVPYILSKMNIKVYGPKFALEILRERLRNENLPINNLIELERFSSTKIGGYNVETFGLTHMTPDALGIAIETEYGYIVVAEKFVIDFDMHDKAFNCDIGAIADIGKKGVFALLMESSYSSVNNFTAPRHRVTEMIKPIFEESKQRIIISVYNQNIFRIKEIVKLASEYKRKVYFYNKELSETFRLLNNLDYYKLPKDIEVEKFSNNQDDIVIILAGQGINIFDLMNKVAINEDEKIELRESDVVIIASPIVSGTEKKASQMENELYKDNVNVYKLNKNDLLAMHPAKEDMKMMLYLLKPKYFIPTMGEYVDFMNAADLALEVGFTPDKIIILDNGQIATFEDGRLSKTNDLIDVNEILIGNSDNKDIASYVLRDRETLSTDGVLVIGIVVNHQTKEVYAGPDIQSRGVMYVKENENVIKNLGDMVVEIVESHINDKDYDNLAIRAELRESISKYVFKETGKKPMIIPTLLEINV